MSPGTGHIADHCLSAASLMWVTAQDRRFKERPDDIVTYFNEIPDQHGSLER